MAIPSYLTISHAVLIGALQASPHLTGEIKRFFSHLTRPGALRTPTGAPNLGVTIGDLPALEIRPVSCSATWASNQVSELRYSYLFSIWTREHDSAPIEKLFTRFIAALYQSFDNVGVDGRTNRIQRDPIDATITEGYLDGDQGTPVTVLQIPLTVIVGGWNPKTAT